MKLSDFEFDLPSELIAQHPLPLRSQSRLLKLDRESEQVSHHLFRDLSAFLNAGDLLVFNESKVIPARFFGRKSTGGRVEFLIERILDGQTALSHVKANKPIPLGTELILDNEQKVTLFVQEEGLFKILLHLGNWKETLDEIGRIPLPPYITRNPDDEDLSRYQTVYAQQEGSVAAPTAGLHFDQTLLNQLTDKGVRFAFVTLHVGAGTFQPVRTENIENHPIHQEWIEVTESVCEKVRMTRQKGGRVIAVGTTSVRALESASSEGEIKPYSGYTRLFIYPGYSFKSIDSMITNFHVPKSSLLMLVSAFAGYERIMKTYQVAIQEKYRFFSYGDAMIVF